MWTMKVRVICQDCGGSGGDDVSTCSACNGKGHIMKKVLPNCIDEFSSSPPSAEFSCSGCRHKENILRPLQHQIPHGWINWGGALLCSGCKAKVVLAAIMGANKKVVELTRGGRG